MVQSLRAETVANSSVATSAFTRARALTSVNLKINYMMKNDLMHLLKTPPNFVLTYFGGL